MILASFEVWHSRPVAPTRRVALGVDDLPVDPAPGFGGLLLAGVVAAHVDGLDEDEMVDLAMLMREVEAGYRIPQPRLRHRFQIDRIGLTCATHQLLGDGESLSFDFADAPPAPQILAAVYRAGRFPLAERRSVFTLLRSAARWRGGHSPDLVAFLTGRRSPDAWMPAQIDPVTWALGVLGFGDGQPSKREVQKRFRKLLRDAHPDHGGESDDAATRIGELSEARRILTA